MKISLYFIVFFFTYTTVKSQSKTVYNGNDNFVYPPYKKTPIFEDLLIHCPECEYKYDQSYPHLLDIPTEVGAGTESLCFSYNVKKYGALKCDDKYYTKYTWGSGGTLSGFYADRLDGKKNNCNLLTEGTCSEEDLFGRVTKTVINRVVLNDYIGRFTIEQKNIDRRRSGWIVGKCKDKSTRFHQSKTFCRLAPNNSNVNDLIRFSFPFDNALIADENDDATLVLQPTIINDYCGIFDRVDIYIKEINQETQEEEENFYDKVNLNFNNDGVGDYIQIKLHGRGKKQIRLVVYDDAYIGVMKHYADVYYEDSEIRTDYSVTAENVTYSYKVDEIPIDVLPSCAGVQKVTVDATGTDDPTTTDVDESAVALYSGGYGINGENGGGFQLQKGITYTFQINGIINFDKDYSLNPNDGTATQLDQYQTEVVKFLDFKDLGNGKFSVTPTVERAHFAVSITPQDHLNDGDNFHCLHPGSVNLYIGGTPVHPPIQVCSVVLPDGSGSELIPELALGGTSKEYILDHFDYKIESERGVILKPGIELVAGAQLTLVDQVSNKDPLLEVVDDPYMNWLEVQAYDDYGRMTSSSKSFFNQNGQALQSQSYRFSTADILSTATLYDFLDRPALQSLAAPVYETNTLDMCGDPANISGQVAYRYKEDLLLDEEGNPYQASHFDGDKLGTPDRVGHQEGTIGWYYSKANTEEGLATTHYPFAQSEYYEDGTDRIKTTVPAGDIYRGENKHEHTVISDLLPVTANDPELLAYTRMYQAAYGTTKQASDFAQHLFIQQSIDPNGIEVHTYIGSDEKAYIVCNKGESNHKAFNLYDDEGNLAYSITPNGVARFLNEGESFATIDKTQHIYDFAGRLIKTIEKDAGITEFVYRKDGLLRFSQNAEQATRQAFSYTNYDALNRPISSGELITHRPTFRLAQLKERSLLVNGHQLSLLEAVGYDSYLDIAFPSAEFKEVVKTYYDLPTAIDEVENNDFPFDGVAQHFMQGAVSYTEKPNISKVWYNYDERGRVTHYAKEIIGLGLFKYQYSYGPKGNVLQIQYDRPHEDSFYYGFEYSLDNQLSKIYTHTAPFEREEDPTTYEDHISNGTLHAQYYYNRNGSIRRKELFTENTMNEDQRFKGLQGIDYTYTIEGWLKAINNPKLECDPGKDAIDNTDFLPDAFALSLDYYQKDFINEHTGFGTLDVTVDEVTDDFAGNIKMAAHYIKKPAVAELLEEEDTEIEELITANAYVYDDLYRLKSSLQGLANYDGTTHDDLDMETVERVGVKEVDRYEGKSYLYRDRLTLKLGFSYKATEEEDKFVVRKDGFDFVAETQKKNEVEALAYDANGNITSLHRYGEDANSTEDDDDFTGGAYQYQENANKLTQVTDYAEYQYDKIGQLVYVKYLDAISEEGEKKDLEQWLTYNVLGKVSKIVDRVEGEAQREHFSYVYDEAGSRLKKIDHLQGETTFYAYDADGNLMSIYDDKTQQTKSGDNLTGMQEKELFIRGADRIGYYQETQGDFVYELKDHLGSVRSSIYRTLNEDHELDIKHYADYYPFGKVLAKAGESRYGYQGEFAEDETEETGYNSFEARNYDPVTGRWLSVDPARQFASPYLGMGNNPINGVDPDGEWFDNSSQSHYLGLSLYFDIGTFKDLYKGKGKHGRNTLKRPVSNTYKATQFSLNYAMFNESLNENEYYKDFSIHAEIGVQRRYLQAGKGSLIASFALHSEALQTFGRDNLGDLYGEVEPYAISKIGAEFNLFKTVNGSNVNLDIHPFYGYDVGIKPGNDSYGYSLNGKSEGYIGNGFIFDSRHYTLGKRLIFSNGYGNKRFSETILRIYTIPSIDRRLDSKSFKGNYYIGL